MQVNIVGFDEKATIKRGLPIVSAITAVDVGDKAYLFKVNKAILNEDSTHSLIGEFQMREHIKKLDSVSRHHGPYM